MGKYCQVARDHEQVEVVLQQAVPLAREEENTDLLQQGLMSLGDIAFHIGGDVETANGYWQEALQLLGKQNTREQRLRLLSNLGMIAGIRQEREQAEQYFLDVLAEVKTMQHPEQECMTLLNLGYLYVNVQGKQAKAEDYYHQALTVTVRYGLEEKSCLARVVLGELARRRGDIEEAERLLQEALVAARSLEDPLALSQVLDGYALIKIELESGRRRRSMCRKRWHWSRTFPMQSVRLAGHGVSSCSTTPVGSRCPPVRVGS